MERQLGARLKNPQTPLMPVPSWLAARGFHLPGMIVTAALVSACGTAGPDSPLAPTDRKQPQQAHVAKPARSAVDSFRPDAASFVTTDWRKVRMRSAQTLEYDESLVLAGNRIEVLKVSPKGRILEARATGRVHLEWIGGTPGRLACREAYLNQDEIVVRGRPILARGPSILEGLDDTTVFYLVGTRLKVLGRHRNTTAGAVLAEERERRRRSAPKPGCADGTGSFPPLPSEPVVFNESLAPSGLGPNPLLPPLSISIVPEEVRRALRADPEVNTGRTPGSIPGIPAR